MGDECTKVGVHSDHDSFLWRSRLEHRRIRCACQPDIVDVEDTVAASDELLLYKRGDALVEQEPQAPRRRGSSRSRTASAAYSSASRMSGASR